MKTTAELRSKSAMGEFRSGNDVCYGLEALILHALSNSREPVNARMLGKAFCGRFDVEISERLNAAVIGVNMGMMARNGKIVACDYSNGIDGHSPLRTYRIRDISEEERQLIMSAIERRRGAFKGYQISEDEVIQGEIGLITQLIDGATENTPVTHADICKRVYWYTRDISVDSQARKDTKKAIEILVANGRQVLRYQNGRGYFIASPEEDEDGTDNNEDGNNNNQEQRVRDENELHARTMTGGHRAIIALQTLHLLKQDDPNEKLEDTAKWIVHQWFHDNMGYLPLILTEFEKNKKGIVGQEIKSFECDDKDGKEFFGDLKAFIDSGRKLWEEAKGIVEEDYVKELYQVWLTKPRSFREWNAADPSGNVSPVKDQADYIREKDPRFNRKMGQYLRILGNKGLLGDLTSNQMDVLFRRFNGWQRRFLVDNLTNEGYLTVTIDEKGKRTYDQANVLFLYYLSEHRDVVKEILEHNRGVYHLIAEYLAQRQEIDS